MEKSQAIHARIEGVLIEHRGRRPNVHPSAYVAPTAVLCGDVRVGADARILFNAVVTAEDGSVELGERVVVMEHALVRGRAAHPVVIEHDVLIGPHAHVNGVRIGAEAFVATGAALFPGATIGERAEVRIHAVVHVNSTVARRRGGADRLGRRRRQDAPARLPRRHLGRPARASTSPARCTARSGATT